VIIKFKYLWNFLSPAEQQFFSY